MIETVSAPPSSGENQAALDRKLDQLGQTLDALKTHLNSQRGYILRLRHELNALSGPVSELSGRVAVLQNAARVAALPLPQPKAQPAPAAPSASGGRVLDILSYSFLALTMIACEIAYRKGMILIPFIENPPAQALPLAAQTSRPAPEAPGAPAPELGKNEPLEAALRLVYSYKLPGRDVTVQNLLSRQKDAVLEAQRLGPSKYLISFKPAHASPDQAAPVLEFEADVATGQVEASPTTSELVLASTKP